MVWVTVPIRPLSRRHYPHCFAGDVGESSTASESAFTPIITSMGSQLAILVICLVQIGLQWREQETSSLDISIQGIGWGSENSEARKELLRVLAVLTDVAKKFEPKLRDAMRLNND